MKTSFILFLAASAALFLVTSCGAGVPGSDDLEKTLKETIKSESEGRVELVSLVEKGSQEKEVFGQKTYTISYEATIRFKEDCFMYYNRSGYGPLFDSFRTYVSEPEFNPGLQMQIGVCEKNKEIIFPGTANFILSDDGKWVQTY